MSQSKKLAMEKMVCTHPRSLILRLPQVAGITPNPHTLLNYLNARISSSERFDLWDKAKRNIIDVIDVASIAQQLIVDDSARNTIINIANSVNYHMVDIVSAMERSIGKHAIYDIVAHGSEYPIDTHAIRSVLNKSGVKFGDDYLEKVIGKVYRSITVWRAHFESKSRRSLFSKTQTIPSANSFESKGGAR